VIAMESYEQFAENLQKEIEQDTGSRFGIVESHQFAAIAVAAADGTAAPLGFEQSKALWESLKAAGHIDARGKVQDSLKTALKNDTLTVPDALTAQLGQITAVLKKLAGRLEIENADERRQVYRVEFDNEKLVDSGTRALQDAPPIAKARLQWRKADIAIGKAGVEATEREGAGTVVLDEGDIELPDLLTDLQDRTQLTRRTRNPQQFIALAAEAINRCKRLAVVDGIQYQRLGDEDYYAQTLFENEELTGYLKNLLAAEKSVYEQVVYDSDTEATFADQLEKNAAIRVYAKLPGWFKVPTPLGS